MTSLLRRKHKNHSRVYHLENLRNFFLNRPDAFVLPGQENTNLDIPGAEQQFFSIVMLRLTQHKTNSHKNWAIGSTFKQVCFFQKLFLFVVARILLKERLTGTVHSLYKPTRIAFYS